MTENDSIIQIKKTKKFISGKSSQKMKWSDEMLTEERLQEIERIVKEKGSASIPELMERMGISESTARRDLTTFARNELFCFLYLYYSVIFRHCQSFSFIFFHFLKENNFHTKIPDKINS